MRSPLTHQKNRLHPGCSLFGDGQRVKGSKGQRLVPPVFPSRRVSCGPCFCGGRCALQLQQQQLQPELHGASVHRHLQAASRCRSRNLLEQQPGGATRLTGISGGPLRFGETRGSWNPPGEPKTFAGFIRPTIETRCLNGAKNEQIDEESMELRDSEPLTRL